MQGKRSRIEIIYDMLLTISNKGGRIKPTHLMYKANLSHNQMKLYLDELMAKNFIEEEAKEERKILIITDKGFAFIQQFNQMKEFEKTFGL
ncbi:MAG: winged helix-turn-helix domain-containing protein [archaeon]